VRALPTTDVYFAILVAISNVGMEDWNSKLDSYTFSAPTVTPQVTIEMAGLYLVKYMIWTLEDIFQFGNMVGRFDEWRFTTFLRSGPIGWGTIQDPTTPACAHLRFNSKSTGRDIEPGVQRLDSSTDITISNSTGGPKLTLNADPDTNVIITNGLSSIPIQDFNNATAITQADPFDPSNDMEFAFDYTPNGIEYPPKVIFADLIKVLIAISQRPANDPSRAGGWRLYDPVQNFTFEMTAISGSPRENLKNFMVMEAIRSAVHIMYKFGPRPLFAEFAAQVISAGRTVGNMKLQRGRLAD